MKAARIVTCLCLLAASGVGAADAPDVAGLRLILREAAVYAGVPKPGDPAVLIDLERTGDRWERGWAASGAFGNIEWEARVDAAKVTDKGVELRLTVSQPAPGPTPGERFKYAVSVTRAAGGRLAGTYTGTVRGSEVKGAVEGEIAPARQVAAGHRPPGAGEHPRLLFRKSDVEALREKAKTAFGKLAMSKLPDSAAGLAMRYQLTGDESLAAEARRRVEAIMRDVEHGDKRVRSRWFGLRVEQAALAYDMCYDAWGPEFRSEVAEYLLGEAHTLFYQRNRGVFDSHISWNLAFSHGPPILFGAGMASLAIHGEKGPKPARPAGAYVIRTPSGVIEPAKGYSPGKGITVAELTSGVMPRTWIYVGAFPAGADHLADVGGRAGVRPAAGMKVTSGGVTSEFRPLADQKGYFTGPLTGNRTKIEITGPAGVVKYSMGYFYAVFRNESERWVRFDTGNGGVEGYLNGAYVVPGEVVRLRPGLYPLLVTGPIGHVKPWGKTFMEPRFTVLTDEQAAAGIAAAKAEHAEQLTDWAIDVAQWERTGGSDPRYLKAYELSRFVLSMIFREVLGTGGQGLSGGDMLAMDGPNKYALAHRNVMGFDVTPYEDVAALLPYKMFVHTYRGDGKALGLESNGPASFASAYYPDNNRSTLMDYYATLYPLVRDAWKPAALWAWRYHTRGDSDEATWANILTTGRRSGYAYGRSYGTFDTHPIYAFVNYPAGAEAKAPQGVMPLTWRAPGGGFYGFRNNWSGTDDEVITHFYGHTAGGGAGTLRLVGLGSVWSHGLAPTATERYGENVVQIPDYDFNSSARGKVTWLETRPDGSGALTVNLDDVHTAPKLDARGRAEKLYEKYGGARRDLAYGDQGIKALRAMAVDYSGASGAPCLIVMVDRIRGGGQKLWTWQLESKQEAGPRTTRVKSDVKQDILFDGKRFTYKIGQLLKREVRTIDDDPVVKIAGAGFTLTRGDATLAATFVAPSEPKVELAERVEYRQGVKSGVARNSSKAIFAEGGGDFFVILTLQRGRAPKVTAKGKGLDAVVTVGGQTVRFDGRKIVFGK